MTYRTITTDRYNIKPTKQRKGNEVDLRLIYYPDGNHGAGLWKLNGEVMDTLGEVFANLGMIAQHMVKTDPESPVE